MSSTTVVAAGGTRPVFESPVQIVGSALLSAALVGVLLATNLQLGVALLAGVLYLPLALLNLPLAIAFWVPLVYLQSWAPVRFVPTGVAILLGLAWLGTLGGGRNLAAEVVRRHRGTFLLMATFLAWITLSLAWASDPALGADSLWTCYMAAAILLVTSTTLSTRRELVIVCAGFVVAALVSIVLAVPDISTVGPPAESDDRLGGSVQNPNYLAAGLLSAAVLAAGLIPVVSRPRSKWLLGCALLLIGAGLLATGSRGGLIAVAVATAAALLLMRGQRARVGALAVAGVVVGGLWFATVSGSVVERVWEFETGNGRVDLWSIAWRIGEEHPVLGVGWDNFRAESPDYVLRPGQLENVNLIVETPKEVHNAYLSFFAETGVVGLGLWLAVVFALMRTTKLAAERLQELGDPIFAGLARTVLIAQIGALAALVFAENPFNNALWILLAFGPVLLTIANRTPHER